MRIREENRNMVLLAAVGLVSAALAFGVTLVQPAAGVAAKEPIYLASDRATVGSDGPVRVIGTPFVPNTNPRER